jgi:hypothetical protein
VSLSYYLTAIGLILVWIGTLGILLWWGLSDIPSRGEKTRKRLITLFMVIVGIACVNLLVNGAK